MNFFASQSLGPETDAPPKESMGIKKLIRRPTNEQKKGSPSTETNNNEKLSNVHKPRIVTGKDLKTSGSITARTGTPISTPKRRVDENVDVPSPSTKSPSSTRRVPIIIPTITAPSTTSLPSSKSAPTTPRDSRSGSVTRIPLPTVELGSIISSNIQLPSITDLPRSNSQMKLLIPPLLSNNVPTEPSSPLKTDKELENIVKSRYNKRISMDPNKEKPVNNSWQTKKAHLKDIVLDQESTSSSSSDDEDNNSSSSSPPINESKSSSEDPLEFVPDIVDERITLNEEEILQQYQLRLTDTTKTNLTFLTLTLNINDPEEENVKNEVIIGYRHFFKNRLYNGTPRDVSSKILMRSEDIAKYNLVISNLVSTNKNPHDYYLFLREWNKVMMQEKVPSIVSTLLVKNAKRKSIMQSNVKIGRSWKEQAKDIGRKPTTRDPLNYFNWSLQLQRSCVLQKLQQQEE